MFSFDARSFLPESEQNTGAINQCHISGVNLQCQFLAHITDQKHMLEQNLLKRNTTNLSNIIADDEIHRPFRAPT